MNNNWDVKQSTDRGWQVRLHSHRPSSGRRSMFPTVTKMNPTEQRAPMSRWKGRRRRRRNDDWFLCIASDRWTSSEELSSITMCEETIEVLKEKIENKHLIVWRSVGKIHKNEWKWCDNRSVQFILMISDLFSTVGDVHFWLESTARGCPSSSASLGMKSRPNIETTFPLPPEKQRKTIGIFFFVVLDQTFQLWSR